VSRGEFSEEAKQFLGGSFLSGFVPWGYGHCPACGRRIWRQERRLLKSDGTEVDFALRTIDSYLVKSKFEEGTQIQCRKCGQAWPLFEGQTPSQHIVEIIETDRSETHVGTDRYPMSNASPGAIERRLKLEQGWSKTWSIEYEKATRTNIAAEFASKAGGLKHEIEQQIRDKYAATDSVSRTYSDELTVSVEANSKVIVSIFWKKIWQHGIIKLDDGGEVPFKVAVQLTYDFSKDVVES